MTIVAERTNPSGRYTHLGAAQRDLYWDQIVEYVRRTWSDAYLSIAEGDERTWYVMDGRLVAHCWVQGKAGLWRLRLLSPEDGRALLHLRIALGCATNAHMTPRCPFCGIRMWTANELKAKPPYDRTKWSRMTRGHLRSRLTARPDIPRISLPQCMRCNSDQMQMSLTEWIRHLELTGDLRAERVACLRTRLLGLSVEEEDI